MLLRGGKKRVGVVLMAAALAMAAVAPAGAAGWDSWSETREPLSGCLPRVFSSLWLAVSPVSMKCDQTTSVDPNGCPKKGGRQEGEPARGTRVKPTASTSRSRG